jgi:RNA recognition motif-containing protein
VDVPSCALGYLLPVADSLLLCRRTYRRNARTRRRKYGEQETVRWQPELGTTEDDLRAVFGSYGPLGDVKVVTDRETGKSRGFGFLTFEHADDAGSSISSLTRVVQKRHFDLPPD